MTQTPKETQLDRATDPEYAAVSSAAAVSLVIAVLGIWPLLLISNDWVEPPSSVPDLVVSLAIFAATPLVGLVIGLLAYRQIRRSHGVLTGTRLALAGVAVGAGLMLVWSGWLVYQWRQNDRILHELEATAYRIIDELIQGRYDDVYQRLPVERRKRQPGGSRLFRARMAQLFEGAGAVTDRRLMSLRLVPTEQGAYVAPAEMRVDLERRILQISLLLGLGPEEKWELVDLRGGPTFESMIKFDNPYDKPEESDSTPVPTATETPPQATPKAP
ncbi:MAG TPA: DUF4190 domain-containing protein [Phycisphaerae bacterium]|nr:DUF4190 domain-containing protein [Phycisphaerae bacterium]